MINVALTLIPVTILMGLIGVPLWQRKIAPNMWYGVRLPATLRDEELWYEVNAYTGRDFVVYGIVASIALLVLSLLPLSQISNLVVAISVLTGGVLIVVARCLFKTAALQKAKD